jgi:hypothetical protein
MSTRSSVGILGIYAGEDVNVYRVNGVSPCQEKQNWY